MAAHVSGFGSGNGDLDAALAVEFADLIDHRLERVEVDDDVLVDIDAEIRCDCLFQKVYAADGIGGIQLGAVFAGYLDIEVTQEGRHFELFMLAVDGEHHHSVASAFLAHGTAVTAYKQDILDVGVKQNRCVRQFDLGVVHAVHLGRRLRVRLRVVGRTASALIGGFVLDKVHSVEQRAGSHSE